MADIDFKSRNDFRKGMQLRKIDEDPTYLSFMFLFHYNDHTDVGHSPLLDGTAEKYLRNVVRDDVGEAYADNVKNFVRVLRKVNMEMPWFWNGLKGLELALNYGDMKEPWRGAEKPTLEIECLEENIELTAIGLMDLYKRSCFDFERYVEVVPRNLREFSLDIIVSEVRVFQKDTAARDRDFKSDENPSQLTGPGAQGGTVKTFNDQVINKDFTTADVTPFIRLRFTHCEFDINSIADYFADMSKNPELKKPVIKINWGTCTQIDQKLGQNLFNEKVDADKPINARINEEAKKNEQKATEASDVPGIGDKYLNALRGQTIGKVESTIQSIKDGVTRNVEDIQNSFANPDQPGLVNTILTGQTNKLTQALLIGNVHGIDNISNDINSAIAQGSLNGIANLFGGDSPLGNIGDIAIDSTPDNVTLGKAHDTIAPDNDDLGQENIHPDAVDSTPDGTLKENVHE